MRLWPGALPTLLLCPCLSTAAPAFAAPRLVAGHNSGDLTSVLQLGADGVPAPVASSPFTTDTDLARGVTPAVGGDRIYIRA